MHKFDGTPESAWGVVADLSQFFLERNIKSGPYVNMIFGLFIEMHCSMFPEERITMTEDMMKKMQGVLTEHKGTN
jgi:hypothetical protein